MAESKSDLIIHPIRLRMIQALLGGRPLTARELAGMMPDVPQATLYRHLNKLAGGGVLRVAEERPVRGTIEKSYTVLPEAVHVTADEIAQISREDQMRYFTVFVTTLLQDFEQYLRRDSIDYAKDGVGYRQVTLNLSDDEFLDFAGRLREVVLEAAQKKPSPGREGRRFTTIIMPEPEEKLGEQSPESPLGENTREERT